MLLARVLSKIYKEGGIILQDEKGVKYVIGNPKSENPTTVKLFNKKLKYLLLNTLRCTTFFCGIRISIRIF